MGADPDDPGDNGIPMSNLLPGVLFLATVTLPCAAQTGGPAIVYVDTRSTAIKVMNDDGSDQVTVYTPSASTSPSMSPDGQQVAFAATINGQKGVYVVNSNGDGLHLVTPLLYGSPELIRPAWSPTRTVDGQYKLLFWDYALLNPVLPTGPYDLFVVNLDGSGRTQLTNDTLVEGYPEWSPDATRIVFTRTGMVMGQLGLFNGQIVLIGMQQMTNLAGSPLQASTSLAFCGWANTADTLLVSAVTPDSNGQFDLWSIPVQNPTQPLRLTRTPKASERWATFSADDGRIFFHGGKGVMMMNPNGSGVTLIHRYGWRPNHRRR